VTVTATATADTFCFNPSDPDQSHPVPGQTLEDVAVTGGTGEVTPDVQQVRLPWRLLAA
jgi:hypothetical protein